MELIVEAVLGAVFFAGGGFFCRRFSAAAKARFLFFSAFSFFLSASLRLLSAFFLACSSLIAAILCGESLNK